MREAYSGYACGGLVWPSLDLALAGRLPVCFVEGVEIGGREGEVWAFEARFRPLLSVGFLVFGPGVLQTL